MRTILRRALRAGTGLALAGAALAMAKTLLERRARQREARRDATTRELWPPIPTAGDQRVVISAERPGDAAEESD
jgi:hypothetical protein